MIKSLMALTAGLILSFYAYSQETQALFFPSNMPCGNTQKIKETISKYKEIGFASGTGMLLSGKDGEYHKGLIKVYLSHEGTFTITAEIDTGIVCLLTSGINFKPIIPIHDMN